MREWCLMYDKKSYREPINTCQAWSVRLNDKRRRPAPLWTNADGVCTGLHFSATMLRDGRRAPKERTVLPVVVPMAEAPPPEEVEAVDIEALQSDFVTAFNELGSDEIGIGMKFVLGWACSYRSAQPEKRSFQAWRARWAKARKSWQGIPLQAPRHRRPQEEQLAQQKLWRQRRPVQKVPVVAAVAGT